MHHANFPSPILARTVLLLIGLLLLPFPARAAGIQARQWELSADKLTRHENPPTIIAEGNVVLEKKEPVTAAPKRQPSQWSGLLDDEPAKDSAKPAPSPAAELKAVTTVKADWVSYDITNGLLTARGHLLIDIGTDQLKVQAQSRHFVAIEKNLRLRLVVF